MHSQPHSFVCLAPAAASTRSAGPPRMRAPRQTCPPAGTAAAAATGSTAARHVLPAAGGRATLTKRRSLHRRRRWHQGQVEVAGHGAMGEEGRRSKGEEMQSCWRVAAGCRAWGVLPEGRWRCGQRWEGEQPARQTAQPLPAAAHAIPAGAAVPQLLPLPSAPNELRVVAARSDWIPGQLRHCNAGNAVGRSVRMTLMERRLVTTRCSAGTACKQFCVSRHSACSSHPTQPASDPPVRCGCTPPRYEDCCACNLPAQRRQPLPQMVLQLHLLLLRCLSCHSQRFHFLPAVVQLQCHCLLVLRRVAQWKGLVGEDVHLPRPAHARPCPCAPPRCLPCTTHLAQLANLRAQEACRAALPPQLRRLCVGQVCNRTVCHPPPVQHCHNTTFVAAGAQPHFSGSTQVPTASCAALTGRQVGVGRS